MILKGRNAIITGGSMGLGLTIARAFVTNGASVFLCARDITALQTAQQELETLVNAGQHVYIGICDVSVEGDVERMFQQALNALGSLDILVNNAGVYGPMGPVESLNTSEWRKAIEINLFGALYASQKAIEAFKPKKAGKIINLSGGGATAPLPFISAYAASKAALVRLTETLAVETKEFGIDVNAIAPGALNTRLMEEVLEAGPEKVGEAFFASTVKQQHKGGTALDKGAQLCVYLASTDSNGISGKLISAVWDSWSDFNEHRHDIENTDLYTLRRIVTTDRDMDWETL